MAAPVFHPCEVCAARTRIDVLAACADCGREHVFCVACRSQWGALCVDDSLVAVELMGDRAPRPYVPRRAIAKRIGKGGGRPPPGEPRVRF